MQSSLDASDRGPESRLPRRLALIVNPRSGKRRARAILDQVRPIFAIEECRLDVHVTRHAGHARDIARTLPLEDHDGLCVIGGDGTLHEIVNGLAERGALSRIPLGILPAGTGNDVARQLGFLSPQDASRRIVTGRIRPFDVARVEAAEETHHCLTLVGWAGVADVNRTAERFRLCGPPRYAFAALRQILVARPYRARLILDDGIVEDDFLLVAACNTMFTGSGMRLAPRAQTDDGRIDVVLLRRVSRWQMLRLFARVFDGSHVDLPCVEYHQVRSLQVLTEDRRPLDLDGEIKGHAPLSIRMLPGAIRVFC